MAIVCGVLIGLALGLTGGGGSIFAVPMLVYVLGVIPRDAIGISLVAVAGAAMLGTVGAARSGMIEYRAGVVFAAGGLLAAPGGIWLGRQVSEQTILLAFALLMFGVGLLMWRNAVRKPEITGVVRASFATVAKNGAGPLCRFEPDSRLRLSAPCSAALCVAGTGTGVLAGFFGVGGGFLIVPALMFITQLDIRRSVATSLFVISCIALSGVATLLIQGGRPPWPMTGLFLAGALLGMLLGRLLAARLAGALLQKIFAGGVMLVAVSMLTWGR